MNDEDELRWLINVCGIFCITEQDLVRIIEAD